MGEKWAAGSGPGCLSRLELAGIRSGRTERFCPPTAVERWLEDAVPLGQTTSPADAGGE
jgi:hypothetical protein